MTNFRWRKNILGDVQEPTHCPQRDGSHLVSAKKTLQLVLEASYLDGCGPLCSHRSGVDWVVVTVIVVVVVVVVFEFVGTFGDLRSLTEKPMSAPVLFILSLFPTAQAQRNERLPEDQSSQRIWLVFEKHATNDRNIKSIKKAKGVRSLPGYALYSEFLIKTL